MIDRRTLLQTGVVVGAVAAVARRAAADAGDLDELTIAQLGAKLAAKTETAASLVDKYRKKIAAVNEQGPELRAVLELDPDADAIAKQLDAERAAGKVRGPLHGIPILVKDNIDTAGKLMTSAGSLVLAGTHAPKDATTVAKLRAAGAIILGKTNLSEWANFRGPASSSGWSARGGQCRNPYALDRSPSGSSSGSGVAVAANLCAAALGSETDGSIVSPSSCNGIVGIKPTIGLVSRAGVIPIAPSQDTVGPMARTVADAALLLAAIAGPDPRDPTTAKAQPADYVKALDAKALTGARLGVLHKGYLGANRAVDSIVTPALAKLKQLGAVLVDVELELPPDVGPAELDILKIEMAVAMVEYLKGRPDTKIRSLADAVAFNQRAADRELHLFGQEFFEQALKTKGLTDKSYLDAKAKCAQVGKLIDKVMTDNKLDALVAGTNGPAWVIDPIVGDNGSGYSDSTPAAVAGYPHVTVPAGQVFGLPIGLSFFGRAFSEAKLIGYAYAYEQATHHRKPPRFLPTADLK